MTLMSRMRVGLGQPDFLRWVLLCIVLYRIVVYTEGHIGTSNNDNLFRGISIFNTY